MRAAIAASLNEMNHRAPTVGASRGSSAAIAPPPHGNVMDLDGDEEADEDDELRAAIALSLSPQQAPASPPAVVEAPPVAVEVAAASDDVARDVIDDAVMSASEVTDASTTATLAAGDTAAAVAPPGVDEAAAPAANPSLSRTSSSDDGSYHVVFTLGSRRVEHRFPPESTVQDLFAFAHSTLDLAPSAKLLIRGSSPSALADKQLALAQLGVGRRFAVFAPPL